VLEAAAGGEMAKASLGNHGNLLLNGDIIGKAAGDGEVRLGGHEDMIRGLKEEVKT